MVEQISGSSLVLVFLDYCMVNIDPAPLQIISSSSAAWRAGVEDVPQIIYPGCMDAL